MRYRIKDYLVSMPGGTDTVNIFINVSKEVYDSLETNSVGGWVLNEESFWKAVEAVRLIVDESRGGYVLCSSGNKNVFSSIAKRSDNTGYYLQYQTSKSMLTAAAGDDKDDLAAIEAMADTDKFTIEVDWGESPDELKGNLVEATEAEYAAFKSHMTSEIANVLTPITE